MKKPSQLPFKFPVPISPQMLKELIGLSLCAESDTEIVKLSIMLQFVHLIISIPNFQEQSTLFNTKVTNTRVLRFGH